MACCVAILQYLECGHNQLFAVGCSWGCDSICPVEYQKTLVITSYLWGCEDCQVLAWEQNEEARARVFMSRAETIRRMPVSFEGSRRCLLDTLLSREAVEDRKEEVCRLRQVEEAQGAADWTFEYAIMARKIVYGDKCEVVDDEETEEEAEDEEEQLGQGMGRGDGKATKWENQRSYGEATRTSMALAAAHRRVEKLRAQKTWDLTVTRDVLRRQRGFELAIGQPLRDSGFRPVRDKSRESLLGAAKGCRLPRGMPAAKDQDTHPDRNRDGGGGQTTRLPLAITWKPPVKKTRPRKEDHDGPMDMGAPAPEAPETPEATSATVAGGAGAGAGGAVGGGVAAITEGLFQAGQESCDTHRQQDGGVVCQGSNPKPNRTTTRTDQSSGISGATPGVGPGPGSVLAASGPEAPSDNTGGRKRAYGSDWASPSVNKLCDPMAIWNKDASKEWRLQHELGAQWRSLETSASAISNQ